MKSESDTRFDPPVNDQPDEATDFENNTDAADVELNGQLADDLRVVLDRRKRESNAVTAVHDAPMGWRVAHYEVQALLGEGGMARVYRALDTTNEQLVAIKILRRELQASPDIRSRFEQEAASMRRIEHPNVVRVLDTPSDRSKSAIVMELLGGGSLRELIQIGAKRQKRMGIDALARFALETARGVGAAHQAGIIHRDIKPSNLLLNEEGSVKIGDFGVVLALERATWLTGLGRPIGTPAYMSPEQCKGARVTAASDIYSLGVTLFELATGQLPFTEQADSPFALMLKHIRLPPPDPRKYRSNLPRWFAKILLQCLEKNPARRFADGTELAKAIAAGPKFARSEPRQSTGQKIGTRLDTVAIREQLKRLPQRAIVAWACRCARRALPINNDPRLARSIEAAEATLRATDGASETGSLSQALLRIQQMRSASFSVVDASHVDSPGDSASCVAIAAAATCACAAARCAADAAADAAFVAEKTATAFALTGRSVSELWRAAQADYRILLAAKLGAEGAIGAPIPSNFWDAHDS